MLTITRYFCTGFSLSSPASSKSAASEFREQVECCSFPAHKRQRLDQPSREVFSPFFCNALTEWSWLSEPNKNLFYFILMACKAFNFQYNHRNMAEFSQ